jgi:uncharacterized Fe-S center protein
MKKKLTIIMALALCIALFSACNSNDAGNAPSSSSGAASTASVSESASGASEESPEAPADSSELSVAASAGLHSFETIDPADLQYAVSADAPVVYYTTDISSEGLMAIYEILNKPAAGENVGVKISTGEPGGNHFLDPNLIKDLVQSVDGTIIESNTAYGGQRASTALHYQVAEDHGFTAIAPVVIMDETDEMTLPVAGGTRMTENTVGARFAEFDFHVVLSHFKGHGMAGFGGALKNLSIGYASSGGKMTIHGGGDPGVGFGAEQDAFLEAMAESAKSVVDAAGDDILYINVMNHLSVDCDCSSNPAAPTRADIAILASLDPVALDQACVDLVYAAPDGKDLQERIEARSGIICIEHAAQIGLGSREYVLTSIDA